LSTFPVETPKESSYEIIKPMGCMKSLDKSEEEIIKSFSEKTK
jgi:hypothetical protein